MDGRLALVVLVTLCYKAMQPDTCLESCVLNGKYRIKNTLERISSLACSFFLFFFFFLSSSFLALPLKMDSIEQVVIVF